MQICHRPKFSGIFFYRAYLFKELIGMNRFGWGMNSLNIKFGHMRELRVTGRSSKFESITLPNHYFFFKY